MSAPIIGITTYGRNEKNHFTLPAEYIESVRRAGGIPVLIPPGEDRTNDLLKRLDGLILAGGGDLDPKCYQGEPHQTIAMVDLERDNSELELTKVVLTKKIPVLCICRGVQVLNVALGGTLIEHLPDVVGEEVIHRRTLHQFTKHVVSVEADSKLAQIMGQAQATTASWHHQAVRSIAPGLEIAARAPDGTIEALERPDHPWLVAVQWHPEITAAQDPGQQRIFDALVQAALEKRDD